MSGSTKKVLEVLLLLKDQNFLKIASELIKEIAPKI